MNQITHEERAKVYADALATFGAEVQLIVALEEMSELQKEICKALRGDIHPAHLAEELADATIMLEQVRQIFSINEPVCRMMDSKIVRLRQRIEAAKEKQELLCDTASHGITVQDSKGVKIAPFAKDINVPTKWISVKDGLPNLIPCDAGTAYSEAVNVLTSGRKVLTAIWDGFDWICDAEFWDAEDEAITHWIPVLLPLPQPPKGE